MTRSPAIAEAALDRRFTPALRPVPRRDPERSERIGLLDPFALAGLVNAPDGAVAEHARAALLPLLSHDALVLVTPASAGAPVQIAAPPRLHDSLEAIEWSRIASAAGKAAEGTTTSVAVPDLVDGLSTAAWSATTGGCTVWLVVCAQPRLRIAATQEYAASHVAMLAAAHARPVADDPPPGTLAFSRAIGRERERVRAQLSSSYAATLSGLLHTLRRSNDGRSRNAPPEVLEAINLASRAVLDLETDSERHDDEVGGVLVSQAFKEAEDEVRRIVHPVRLDVLADLEAEAPAQVPQAIAQAARFISRAAAVNATRHARADKLRLLWRLTLRTLRITVADNGATSGDKAAQLAPFADVERLAALGAEIEFDSNPDWGTTLTCRLPLHDLAVMPETPAAKRLEELRDREREVLELMIAGLRNRDIAERLFISVRTVKYHASNIFEKLDVASRSEAIAIAHSAGVSAARTDADPVAAGTRIA
jgi:DNA-binding CsgD family transcriptional regulator